jgi:ceramide glucosyltransferase
MNSLMLLYLLRLSDRVGLDAEFFMDFFFYLALAVIISQILFDYQMIVNYLYASKKAASKRNYFRPPVALIVPCKGLDAAFEENIKSFYKQDYENFSLWFVVSDKNDPAYEELISLKEKLGSDSKAHDSRILVAGKALSCSQKNHNLLHCYKHLPPNIEVMAFADSDACFRTDWLTRIVHPLRKEKVGVTTGYRWFIPQRNNSATVAMSIINAKIAQLLGEYRFNQAWGGSMAVRVKTFKQLGIEKLWANSVSDDLTVSRAVREGGKKIEFVPACLVASYEQTNWPDFLRFARRQFIITRVNTPNTWRFGLFSSFYSVLGLYGGAAFAAYAYNIESPYWLLFTAVPLVFFLGHLCRSTLRQILIKQILPNDAASLRVSRITDITFGWLFSPLLLAIILSSAFGRRIRWRGITYELIGPTQTVIEARSI